MVWHLVVLPLKVVVGFLRFNNNLNNMDYYKKAEILYRYFGMYGYGHFDLSIEEVAKILELLDVKKEEAFLDINLKELYERLEKQRMG